MDAKNIIAGIVLIIILYLVYIYAFKSSRDSLIAAQSTDNNIVIKKKIKNEINCTYSLWLFVSQWKSDPTPKHIMTRNVSGGGYSPTVYFDGSINNIHITFSSIGESPDDIQINDFPLQSWTNLIISINTNVVDIYINGKLIRSATLSKPPDQPSNNLYLGKLPQQSSSWPPSGSVASGGSGQIQPFVGFVSTVNYISGPITPDSAWNIYMKGYDDAGIDKNLLGNYRLKVSVLNNNSEMNSIEL